MSITSLQQQGMAMKSPAEALKQAIAENFW
jgi:hypothetical protein